MTRYDTPQIILWEIDASKNKGFPYDFPFVFDRENNRHITQPTESWDTSVNKSGRYGVNP